MKRIRGVPPNEPNIYRYTHNGATSWVAQVKRAGRKWIEYFADGDAGPEASLAAARQYLQDLKRRITPWNKLHRSSSVSRTGIIGVTFTDERTRAGTLVRRWIAMWPKPTGGNLKRTFSALKYGERPAKGLAIEARKRGVADLLRAQGRAMKHRPYPEYRDSGVQWLGEVPANWQIKRFRYSCRIREGQVDPEDERFSDHVLIAPNHVEAGTGRILFQETSSAQGATSGKYKVDPGDLIYSKIRPALRKACIADGHWLCSADMYPIRVAEARLDPRFLLYFVLSDPFSRFMIDESMRVAMPKVNRETLADAVLVLPAPAEQGTIVRFLDSETTAIDALIAKMERLIELLQEKRAAVITKAVTKGLDPNTPMKDSGVEWLGEIPAHWEMRRLKECVPSVTVGIVVTPSKYYADEGVPCLRSLNISSGTVSGEDMVFISEEANELHRKSKIYEGDIVVVRTGRAGTAAIVPAAYDGANCIDLLIIRRSERILPSFLYFLLSGEWSAAQVAAHSVGAIQEHYNTSTLASLLAPLIPIEEQRQIAVFLEEAASHIDALIAKAHEGIECLNEYRSALISAAVTGGIDVRGDQGIPRVSSDPGN